MIRPPKPRLIIPHPKPQRLPERSKRMTLVAGFRCRNNGILLCADRAETNDFQKRAVEKIYRIAGLLPCEVFLAGAGPSGVVTNAYTDIHEYLNHCVSSGADIVAEHKILFETVLKAIHERYADNLQECAMNLIIVVAPRTIGKAPKMYRTEGSMVIPAPYYASIGSGKIIADYLADRLYEYGRLDRGYLAVLAAFILQEAENSSSGVGLGAEMIVIYDGENCLRSIPPDSVKEIQAGIPSLWDTVHSYWKEHATMPEWLAK